MLFTEPAEVGRLAEEPGGAYATCVQTRRASQSPQADPLRVARMSSRPAPMMRRFSLWLTVAALALRVVAPLAAYAAVQPMPAFDELCSVAGKPSAPRTASLGDPASPSQRHLLSHCSDCPCGASAAVLPAAFVLPRVAAVGVVVAPVAARATTAAAPALFPPPRGPPGSLASV